MIEDEGGVSDADGGRDRSVADPSGSADVSPTPMRRFFFLAAEAARAQHAPADEWDGFVEALWQQIDAGFGLSGGGEEFDNVPLAWFEHPDDPAVVVWGEEAEA